MRDATEAWEDAEERVWAEMTRREELERQLQCVIGVAWASSRPGE